MTEIDEIIKTLKRYGIYVNKNRVNMAQDIYYDDGTELFILFYDNYKVHVKIYQDGTTRVNTYPIYYYKKKQRLGSESP